MKRTKSTNLIKFNINKFKVSNTHSIKNSKYNYKSSTNIFSFNDDNNEFSKNKDFSSAHNHENDVKNYKSDFFARIIRGKKPSTRKELMIFTEELLNKINNDDNFIGEGHIKENLKGLKLSEAISLNDNNNDSQEVMDRKDNMNKANLGPKLFLTSTSSLSSKTKSRKKIINLKGNKSDYYSPKTSNKKYKLFNNNLKSIKPIELLLRKKEYEFEQNYKTPKSIILLLNKFHENSNLKKISEKNKLKYKYIKSDLDQKTLTIEKREKINLFKLKEYSKFQKYFLGTIKYSNKIRDEINRFRDKHYTSFKNLEIYKKYKQSLLEENDINLLGCVDLRDYKKNKM